MNSKTIMITGASSDIGMELIENISAEYGLIIAHYSHMNDRLSTLKTELGDKLMLIQADFGNENAIADMINTLKSNDICVDHFVHLASDKVRVMPFRKVIWEEIEYGIDVSVKSVFMILKYVLDRMVKNKYGKVVFMLSSNVVGTPAKSQTAYVTSKYALLGLFKSVEAEYSERGISFSAVSPEMIDTKFLSELPELVVETARKASGSGKNLQIGDVVPVFEAILSDESGEYSGKNISIINS